MGLCQVHHVRCVSRQPFKGPDLHHRPDGIIRPHQ